MPPTPAAQPKGKGGIGGKLNRKLGPLPVWAWLIIGSVGGYILYGRFKGGFGGGGTGVETVTGNDSGITPQDMAGAGAPSQNAAPGTQLDQSTLDALGQTNDKLFAQISDLYGRIQGVEDQQASYATTDSGAYVGGTGGGDNGQGGTNTPSGSGIDMATIAAAAGGVLWGGQVFTDKRSLAGWLSQHGVSYAHWAQLHPSAATRLSGPAPASHATPRAASPKPAPRPAAKPAPKPAPKPTPRPAVKPPTHAGTVRPAPKPKPPVRKPPARKPPAKPAPNALRNVRSGR